MIQVDANETIALR